MSKLAQNIREYRTQYRRIGWLLKACNLQDNLRHRVKKRCTIGDYLRSLDNHAMATYLFENYQCHLFDNPAVECLDHDSSAVCVQCWENFLNTKILKG